MLQALYMNNSHGTKKMETVKSIKNFSLYNTADDIIYNYRPTKKTKLSTFFQTRNSRGS